eukprot:scaffold40387_cov37-Attheya_sp.AAC.1
MQEHGEKSKPTSCPTINRRVRKSTSILRQVNSVGWLLYCQLLGCETAEQGKCELHELLRNMNPILPITAEPPK